MFDKIVGLFSDKGFFIDGSVIFDYPALADTYNFRRNYYDIAFFESWQRRVQDLRERICGGDFFGSDAFNDHGSAMSVEERRAEHY